MLSDLVSAFTRMVPYKFTGENTSCDLCGGETRTTVGRRDRYGSKLTTSMCSNCGLVFTDPMPTQDEVNLFYTRFYREHYHNDTVPRKKAIMKGFGGAKRRHDLLKPILTDGAKLVDVGAGGGEFVSYMCEQGYAAQGIEPNEGFANYAAKTYGVNIQNAMWEGADIENGSMDLVVANHVVEHFRSPVEALKEFHSWLKPGGHLLVSVPNIESIGTPYSRFHFAHLYNFSPSTLLMMAKKVGFEEIAQYPATTTTMVLKRGDASDDWFMFPEHAKDMATFFATNTNRRYFLTLRPYTRWFARMGRLSRDMIRSAVMKNPTKT